MFSADELSVVLSALKTLSQNKIVSNPTVVTLNNTEAFINVGSEYPVPSYTYHQERGSFEVSGFVYKPIGIILKVTPQVNKEGYVTLIVQPSYTDTVASAVTTQGSTVYDPISRGASTMVRVKNGQTVVIGGMLSSTEAKSVKKVPLLGYIPIIGWLFTSVSSRRTNTDLVIFVTPTILVD